MQRLRIRYTKTGRVRFVSARDMTSVWERALRRAELPIAYSEGFSPHPKISFPDALPVGYASTGEYAELTFAAPIDPGRGLGRLSTSLPPGMDVMTFVTVPDGARKLAGFLEATLWELEYAAVGDPDELVSELDRRVAAFMAADHVEVIRHRAKGDVTVDVRPAVLAFASSLRGDGPQRTPVLRAVLRNDGPTIRPADLATALATFGDEPVAEPRLYVRVAQGHPTEDGVREALTQQVEPLVLARHAELA